MESTNSAQHASATQSTSTHSRGQGEEQECEISDQTCSTDELRQRVSRAIQCSQRNANCIVGPLLADANRDALLRALETVRQPAQATAAICSTWPNRLPTVLLAILFGFLRPAERIVIAERVCKGFLQASRLGVGWEAEVFINSRKDRDFYVQAGCAYSRLRKVNALLAMSITLGQLPYVLPNLTELHMYEDISQGDCFTVSRLPLLRKLQLSGGWKTNKLPRRLFSNLTHLTWLCVAMHPRVLPEICGLHRLRSLQLREATATDAGSFGVLTNLTNLDLSSLVASGPGSGADSALSRLASLTNLTSLRIYGPWGRTDNCNLTSTGFGVMLRALRNLQSLELGQATIDPASLLHPPASIRSLRLDSLHTVLTCCDRLLPSLRGWSQLEELDLDLVNGRELADLPRLCALRCLLCMTVDSKELDVSALAELPALKVLTLYSPVARFSTLIGTKSLTQLNVHDIHTVNLSPSDWPVVAKLPLSRLQIMSDILDIPTTNSALKNLASGVLLSLQGKAASCLDIGKRCQNVQWLCDR